MFLLENKTTRDFLRFDFISPAHILQGVIIMEIWKPINDYEGLYEISSLGCVRRLHKTIPPRNLTLWPDRNGYLRAALTRDCKTKRFLVHRLVALAFIPNPDGKPEVNHLNGDKSDNRAENLEWATRSENNRHAFATGLNCGRQGEDNHQSKLTNEQVCYARDNPDNLTQRQLAEMLGVGKLTIIDIQFGRRYKKAGGAVRAINLPNPLRLPDEVRNEIRRLFIKGDKEFGASALARKFNVCHQTILNIVKETHA